MLHTNFACMQFNTNEMICIKMARVILAFLLITDKDCSGEKNYACGVVAKPSRIPVGVANKERESNPHSCVATKY